MLSLGRKIGERVILTVPGLADPIVVQVLSPRGHDGVRLGFVADDSVTIDREEVHIEKLRYIEERERSERNGGPTR